jgi:hypothetical protein
VRQETSTPTVDCSSACTSAVENLVRILSESTPRPSKNIQQLSSTPARRTSKGRPTLTHATAKFTTTPPDPILSAYNTLRTLDISRFASLPTRHILHVINRAVVSQSTKAVSDLCEDLSTMDASQTQQDFFQIAHALVLSAVPAQLITPTQAWHVLHAVGERRFSRLSIPAVLALGGLVGRTQPPAGNQLQDMAAMCAKTMIANFPRPLEEGAPGRKYIGTLTQVGDILVVLGNMNQHKVVYELLTTLFRAERVPRSIVQAVDFSTSDVRAIVVDMVIKAAIDWRYLDIAEQVFVQHFPRLPILALGADIVSEQIHSGSHDDFKRCSKLLVSMLTRPEAGSVPHDLLQTFYEAAMARNKGDVAEEVYIASQHVPEPSLYPPPHGECLNWLIRHISLDSMNVHLARQLTRHVVSSGHQLPLQHRASFIALAAQNGFASEARALWETYSGGDDGKIVTGNAATAIRLIRLYVHLTEVQTAKLNVAAGRDNGPDSIRQPEERGGETSRVNPTLITNKGASAPHLRTSSEARVGSEWRLTTEQYRHDLEGFCRRVFDAYCVAKEPLRLASHKDLTSLARMAFLLKENKQGFAALATMLDRKEVPDIYDVNVALSAMAAQSPREAGALLRRMRRHGLQPDGVTFGTVIHHAFLQEDYLLVRWLVSYARWLDGGRISLRAIKSLVHASLRERGVSREARHRNLQRCRIVMASLADIPDTSTAALGLLGVRAALDLGDPRTAFHFWQTYVKTRTDWSNHKERVQRVQLAIQIRQRREQGSLSSSESKLMLHELREEEE